jgi:hypothetical protein
MDASRWIPFSWGGRDILVVVVVVVEVSSSKIKFLVSLRGWSHYVVGDPTYAGSCVSLCQSSADALVEVAVDENMLLGRHKRIPFFFELLSATSFVGDEMTVSRWIGWQLNIFTGCCNEDTTTNIPYDAFGYYKNGIFLIADLMLRPSVFPESLVKFHIGQGQPLQLPVNENGFILASAGDYPVQDLNPLPSENLPRIDVLQTRKSDRNLRIDLEPHWEGDARKVIFRVRFQGQLKCSFSPERLARALLNTDECDGPLESQVVGCEYESEGPQEHGQRELPISGAEWRSMEISQLLQIYSPDVLFRAPDDTSICIHAGGDMVSQVVGLICLKPPVTIASRCLRCAHAALTSQPADFEQPILYGAKAKRVGSIIVDGLDTNVS